MKRLLLATAAVIALAVAAPLATAQYTTAPPTTAPYSTPQQDTTAKQPASPGTPETVAAQDQTSAKPQLDLAQQQTVAPNTLQAETTKPETEASGSVLAQTSAPGAVTPEQSPSMVADQSVAENVATPASLEGHARDAGMEGLPMTAQEVCAPREIALTTSGASLSRDREHQLINAADRASVCEVQRVVINSPNGRADEARQVLIDHGVDASMIEVQDAETGGLEVELTFAGIATSSEQYAQLFSPQQLASVEPSATAPGQTFEPSPSAPPVPGEGPADETEGAMSPTSGNAAATSGVLDT